MAEAQRPPTTASRGFGWEPGTMRKAGVVALLLALLVAGAAWWGYAPAADGPLVPYARQGLAGGAEALRRDLAAEFPAGSALQPLLNRLQTLGMSCQPPPPGPVTWRCNARLQPPGRAQMHAEVVVGGTGERIMSLDVLFSTPRS